MNEVTYKRMLIGVALVFTAAFGFVVLPALVENPNILQAIAGGFVNPYATGYSLDVILCWVVLALWVVYEAKSYSIKHGWVCVALGIVPGVAVGFPLYLVLRSKQLQQAAKRV